MPKFVKIEEEEKMEMITTLSMLTTELTHGRQVVGVLSCFAVDLEQIAHQLKILTNTD